MKPTKTRLDRFVCLYFLTSPIPNYANCIHTFTEIYISSFLVKQYHKTIKYQKLWLLEKETRAHEPCMPFGNAQKLSAIVVWYDIAPDHSVCCLLLSPKCNYVFYTVRMTFSYNTEQTDNQMLAVQNFSSSIEPGSVAKKQNQPYSSPFLTCHMSLIERDDS